MKQVKIRRFRRTVTIVGIIAAQAVLWATSATAAPMDGSGGTESTVISGPAASGGASDLALVALGAGIALVVALTVAYVARNVRRLRHAHA